MRHLLPWLLCLMTIGLANAAVGQSLDELLQTFDSDAPPRSADVRIDAWVEQSHGDGEPHRLVITIEPDGDTRLNADPGITVTPADQPGLVWQQPLPHRHQDLSITYFDPPATIDMPFTGSVGQPVEVLVEYAYCFVDFQCFFGEETLRVDMKATATTG